MAGEYRCTGTLRSTHLDIIATHGFTLNILLDLSHNAHFETVSEGRPHNPVMAKPIELDCQLARGNAPDYAAFLAACRAERVSSPLYHFSRHMMAEARAANITEEQHFENTITQRTIKIEFPQFNDTIAAVNMLVEGTAAGDAVMAATTEDMDDFDALPQRVRESMGMYQRTSATSFTRTAGGDRTERTAYRG